jgi:BirA family biotin operon repressor/biotin-[acetyl-CoA-carboxylase] ligase
LADATFDRRRFDQRLRTRFMGRTLLARAEALSTNDVVWDALAQGLPDGTTVVADAQPEGRGRSGRRWHLAPGKGLALSIVLVQGCDRRQSGTLPLVAGLALARGLETLGVRAQLKWPNDLLLGGRKLSGILCESRRLVPGAGDGAGSDAAVIGVGVNVRESVDDFPPELRASATSLALAGAEAIREDVAAAFLNALETLWTEHQEGGRAGVLAAWKQRASFWGEAVTVHTPSGRLDGVAQDLDEDGGLVLRLADGGRVVALAGDVELPEPERRT